METMKKQNNSATIENTGSTNLIKLSLKKPKHWKWALTTPDSATEPRAPDILLFDHEGNLLVDTRWRKKQHFNNSLKSISFSERHSFTSKFVSNPDNVEGTTDLTHSIGKTRVIEAAENFVRSSYGNNKQRKSMSNEKSLKSTTEKLELSKDKAREIIAYRLKDNVISIGERIDGCPTHKGRNIQSNLKNTAPDLSNKKISIVGEKFEEGNVGDLLLEVSSVQNNIGDTGNHFNEMKMGLNKSKNSRDSFKKNKGRKKSINTHLPNEEDLLLKKSGEVPNSLSNSKNDLNEVNIGFNESVKSRGSFKKNKGGKLEGDKDVKQNSLDISQQSLEKNVGKRLDENTSSHEVGGGFIVTRDITGKHIAFPKPKKESSRVNNENDLKNKCARKVSFDKEGNKLKFVLDDKQEAMGDSAYSGMKKGEEIHGDILSCTDFNKNGGDIVGKLGALPSSDCSEMAIYSCLPSCGSFLRRSKSCKSEKISNPCSRRVSYCDELSDVRKIEVRMTARKKSRERRKLLTKQRSESRGSSSSSCSSSKERTVRPPRSRRKNKRKDRSQSGDRLVSVNGQVVVNGDSARQLLDAAGEHVQLQLLRHGLHYKSLPGCRLSSHKKQRPAAEPTVAAFSPEDQMGSNLSRSKGLTGRRSQSSGNLCNGKSLPPVVGRFFSPCGRESVRPHDRYKLCGSLPNHLDAQDVYVQNEPITDDRLVVACAPDNNNEPLKTVAGDLQMRLGAVPDLDQGYGSGKSPDRSRLPLLTPENTFTVCLVKGSQGLGLSVAGGREEGGGPSRCEGGWPPGLVRIKRLFPNQPAWQCGRLRQGDILLSVNKVPLTGLTNYEALEILRTTPSDVELTVCRPPSEALQQLVGGHLGGGDPLHPPSAPLPPPRRDPSHLSLTLKQPPHSHAEDSSFGEFDVVMTKVNGSLGFTLRKEDESVLGHYVRALVREPALSDGRIRPGDKIVAVNEVDMSQMTHEEAVLFLRQCGEEVRLRLYRDRVQTPVSALSPVPRATNKPILRKEAQDMLSDLAVKKWQSQSPGDSISSGEATLGRTASPRKRRLIKTPSPDSCLANGVLDNPCDLVQAEPLSMPPLSEPVSMPPMLDSAPGEAFSYRNPAYRSANPVSSSKPSTKSQMSEDMGGSRFSEQDLADCKGGGGGDQGGGGGGSKGLLKWKGVVFSPEEEGRGGAAADEGDSSKLPDQSISQIVSETDDTVSSNQVLVVELNRGWNSRLGFSLQSAGSHHTAISAIYPDSVASRDGRLRPGDQLIMVNDESVEGMSTTEVIDLLRKIRGSICITVWRKPSSAVTSTQTSD